MYSGTEKTAERVSKAPCGRAERRGAFWGLLASFNAVTGDRAGGGGGGRDEGVWGDDRAAVAAKQVVPFESVRLKAAGARISRLRQVLRGRPGLLGGWVCAGRWGACLGKRVEQKNPRFAGKNGWRRDNGDHIYPTHTRTPAHTHTCAHTMLTHSHTHTPCHTRTSERFASKSRESAGSFQNQSSNRTPGRAACSRPTPHLRGSVGSVVRCSSASPSRLRV